MFEQEQGNSDDDDDDENDDGKDNDDSLLSVITDGVKDDETTFDDQPTMLLKCASCSGILPLWRDQRNSIVDEQSFCLPDVGSSTIQQGKTLTGHENYQSVCIGAVRVSISNDNCFFVFIFAFIPHMWGQLLVFFPTTLPYP